MRKQAALLIYLEPTPYVAALVRRIKEVSKAPVEVLYVAGNLSQPWNLPLEDISGSFLPRSCLLAAIAVARRLSTGQYDVLHLAGWGHRTLLIALLLGWCFRVPVFLESDTQLPPLLPLWKRTIKRFLYPLLFSIPRRVLPGGSRQAAYFRHYRVQDDRIVVNHMTVDVAGIIRQSDALAKHKAKSALRKEFGILEDQAVFVFVGRLEPYKGIANLLTAFDRVRRDHPEAVLLVVGDGSERKRVLAAARSNQNIRFVGRLTPTDVVKAYHCADIALVPSTFEPWGLVVNEAMAVGLPIVVSDRVGCVGDIVRHGETGLVFCAGSTDELESAMLHLLENPERSAEMGKAARRLISTWTLEAQAKITLDAWRCGMNL